MSQWNFQAWISVFSITSIACSRLGFAEFGGDNSLVSQFAKEFSDTGSRVLLDGHTGSKVFDEDAADNRSLKLRGTFSSASFLLSPIEFDEDSAEHISAQAFHKEWFGSDWNPIAGEQELLNMQYLLAVDGGGTMTKVIYGPCTHRYILDFCCGFVPREKFLDKLTILTNLKSEKEISEDDFLKMLKDQGGFRIPFYPDSPDRGRAPATDSGSVSGRLLLPVTGGLASKLTHSAHPLRQFIWEHDEVLSLAHGLNVFMNHNEMRSYTSRNTKWRQYKTNGCRRNRALFVDLSYQMPFISQFDNAGLGLGDESFKTLSRKGLDLWSFKYWFKRLCEQRLKEMGIDSKEVMEKAQAKVAQRLKIEQDGDIDEQMDKLNELHSAFHTKISDIYKEGKYGLHPLMTAAFMAKTFRLGRNATKADIMEFSVNFAMGYLEMVAQNAVSLAKSYQQMQGAGHVIFSGQLVGDQTMGSQICTAFIRKYVKRLFKVEPRMTHAENETANWYRALQDMSQANDLNGSIAPVDVWFHDMKRMGLYLTTWQRILRISRREGVGGRGLGESIPMREIESSRCCHDRPLQSFVFASVGTGSPIAKVTLRDQEIVDVQKVGGSAIGGGTSVGLLKAATGETSWNDQVARPLTKDSSHIIRMVSKCVAEIVSLTSILQGVSTVVFTGGFFHNNPEAEIAMVKGCLEFGLEVLFQKPDARGFTAAVGASYLSPGWTSLEPMPHS